MATSGKRELIVMVKPDVGFHIEPVGTPSMTAGDVTPLKTFLISERISMRPVFGRHRDRLKAALAARPALPGMAVPDLSVFYAVDAPEERLEHLVERFRQMTFVESAYVKPALELPIYMLKNAGPTGPEPPAVTPDFTGNQTYLDPAPGGIDAKLAWTMTGGGGAGVSIIDIEGAWRFTHEDLTQNQGGVVAGVPIIDLTFRNHGTAVIGVFGGDDNGFGIKGISPDANVRAISHSIGLATAITTAANMLNPGDIILIEAHQPGPRFNFQVRPDERGYIAVQYWPDVFAAITYATVVKGVIVVEAAGNGAEDLDDPIYTGPPPPLGFGAPFNRGVVDNASIIVGAGAPPTGTHGRAPDPDRSRLPFSNFGSCLDAQGWGSEVTTCGYGLLQGGPDEDLWYTDQFNGTSSASPVVVGALACIQGILKAAGKPLLTPISARNLLRDIGSPQQDAPGRPATQRIGSRPNLFLQLAAVI